MPEPDKQYPRTQADEAAEINVDALPQERFDAFAPHDHPIEYESTFSRVSKQTATRIGHAIWEGTGGRGAHSGESRAQRDKEREAVGLAPKYHSISVAGSSRPAEQIEVRRV